MYERRHYLEEAELSLDGHGTEKNKHIPIGHPIQITHEYVKRPPAVAALIRVLNAVLTEKIHPKDQFVIIYPNSLDGQREKEMADRQLEAMGSPCIAIHAPLNSTEFYYLDKTERYATLQPISEMEIGQRTLVTRLDENKPIDEESACELTYTNT